MGVIQELQFRLKRGAFDKIVSEVRAEGPRMGRALAQGIQAAVTPSDGARVATNIINGLRRGLNANIADVRREVDLGLKDTRDAHAAGVAHGKAYNDALRTELRKAQDQGRLTAAEVARALQQGSVSTERAGRLATQSFLGGLQKEHDARKADIAFRLSSNLVSPQQAEKEGRMLAEQFDASLRKHITAMRATGQLTDQQFVKLTNAFKTLGTGASGVVPPLERARTTLGGLATVGSRATGMLATFGVALSAGALKRWLTDVNVEYGNLLTQLETTEKSTARALTAFRRMEAFAVATPFSITQATEAFIRLRAQGITPTAHEMMVLSDFASAKAKSIDELVLAATQAALGQTFRLKAFHVQTKVTADNITLTYGDMTQKVARNAEDVYKALLRIGEANFAGASERQMNRLGGRLSNLQDMIETLARRIGDVGFNEMFGGAVTSATEFLGVVVESEAELRQVVTFVNALITSTTTWLRVLGSGFLAVTKGMAVAITVPIRMIEALGMAVVKTVRVATEVVSGYSPALRKIENEYQAFLDRQDAATGTMMREIGKHVTEGMGDALGDAGKAWGQFGDAMGESTKQLTEEQKKQRDQIWTTIRTIDKQTAAHFRDLDVVAKRAGAIDKLRTMEAQLVAIYNNANASLKQREEAMRAVTEIEEKIGARFVEKLERPEPEDKKSPDERRSEEIGHLAQLSKLNKATAADLTRIGVLETELTGILAKGNLTRARRAELEGQLDDLRQIAKDATEAQTEREDKALDSFLRGSELLDDRTAALPRLLALEGELTARIVASGLATKDRNTLTEAEIALLERRAKIREAIEERGPASQARIDQLQQELQYGETRARAAEELRGLEIQITDEIVRRGLLTRALNEQERKDLDSLLARLYDIRRSTRPDITDDFDRRERQAERDAQWLVKRKYALQQMLQLEKDISAEIAKRAGERGTDQKSDEEIRLEQQLEELRRKRQELYEAIAIDEDKLPLSPFVIFGDTVVEQAQRMQDAFASVFEYMRVEGVTIGNLLAGLAKQAAVEGLGWLARWAGKKVLFNLASAQEQIALGNAALANPITAGLAPIHFAAAAGHYKAAIGWGIIAAASAVGGAAIGASGRSGGSGGGASSSVGGASASDAEKGPVTLFVAGGRFLDTEDERQMEQLAKAQEYLTGRQFVVKRA